MLKVLLLTIITYFAATSAQEKCTVTDDQGKIWDLSKFSKEDFTITRYDGDVHGIAYRTCGNTSLPDCYGNACFLEQSGNPLFFLARWEPSNMTVTAVDNGVKIQSKNGQSFPTDFISFTIEFKCGTNPTSTYTADVVDFIFTASIEDPSFCSDDDDGDDSEDGDDGNLQCQLTRYSPSMVVATMEDPSYDDVSQKSFVLSLDAKDFGGFEYKLSSCFLQTNVGGESDGEHVYKVSMQKSDHDHDHDHDHFSTSVGNSVTFRGISQFRPGSTLGQFKVYCPLVAPNLQLSNIPMSVTLTVGSKSFTQSSSECEFHPYKGIAKNVEVESNLSNKENFVMKITGLYQVIQKEGVLFVGFSPVHSDTPKVTLGTTSDYYFDDPDRKYGTICTLDGIEGLVHAYKSSKYGIEIVAKTTLSSNQNYVISCPHMAASITSGNPSIPSIAYVSDDAVGRLTYSMATNIFI